MRYDFAPMEGLTDSIYRRLHHAYFGGVDRYFMPFLSPTVHRSLTPREERELPYAQSEGFTAVPQLLTKVPEDFLWAAQQCLDRGYDQVNLNLGCPSGTVTAKGKGSGMLRDPEGLDAFLEQIFEKTPLPISIKTRLGFEAPEEFEALLEIFNRYPLAELIIHPRVRKAFYSGPVHKEQFAQGLKNSAAPVCYNGDIRSLGDAQALEAEFPGVCGIMIGRGLIGDPGMLTPGGTSVQALEGFMTELFEQYRVAFGSARNAMFRLKENWGMLQNRFDGGEKLFKRLCKTTDEGEYLAVTRELFRSVPLK